MAESAPRRNPEAHQSGGPAHRAETPPPVPNTTDPHAVERATEVRERLHATAGGHTEGSGTSHAPAESHGPGGHGGHGHGGGHHGGGFWGGFFTILAVAWAATKGIAKGAVEAAKSSGGGGGGGGHAAPKSGGHGGGGGHH